MNSSHSTAFWLSSPDFPHHLFFCDLSIHFTLHSFALGKLLHLLPSANSINMFLTAFCLILCRSSQSFALLAIGCKLG
jgi:hypothetical protein